MFIFCHFHTIVDCLGPHHLRNIFWDNQIRVSWKSVVAAIASTQIVTTPCPADDSLASILDSIATSPRSHADGISSVWIDENKHFFRVAIPTSFGTNQINNILLNLPPSIQQLSGGLLDKGNHITLSQDQENFISALDDELFASFKAIERTIPQIKIELPEGSGLLTTTVRVSSKPNIGKKVVGWITQAGEEIKGLTFDTNIDPPMELWGHLLSAAKQVPRDWRLVPGQTEPSRLVLFDYMFAGVIGVVYFVDAVQHSMYLGPFVQSKCDEIDMLERKLQYIEDRDVNNTIALQDLRDEAVELERSIDDLIAQLDEKAANVRELIELAVSDTETELFMILDNEVIGWKGKQEAWTKQERSLKLTIEDLKSKARSARERDENILDSLRLFVIGQSYLSETDANKIVMDAVPEVLAQVKILSECQNIDMMNQIANAQDQIFTLQEQLKNAMEQSARSNMQLDQLQSRMQALEERISERAYIGIYDEDASCISEKPKISLDIEKYISDLKAENDDLRQRLQASNELFWDMQKLGTQNAPLLCEYDNECIFNFSFLRFSC